MPGFLLYLLVSLLYAALGWFFWRSVMPAKAAPVATRAGRPGQPAALPEWVRLAAIIPLLLHGWLLYQALFDSAGLNLGIGNALLAIAWLTVLVYWLASLHYPLQGLQMLVLPVAAAFLLVAAILPEVHLVPHTGRPLFAAHLLVSLLAYSLFTIAALHALLMALAERRLHDHMLSKMLRNLPPAPSARRAARRW